MTAVHPVGGRSIALLSLVVTACGLPAQSISVSGSCADAARAYDGRPVAGFETSIGAIMRFATVHEQAEAQAQRAHVEVPAWLSELPAGDPAILCYVDDPYVLGPPGPSGEEPRPWDRVAVAVVGGRFDVVVAGYQNELIATEP